MYHRKSWRARALAHADLRRTIGGWWPPRSGADPRAERSHFRIFQGWARGWLSMLESPLDGNPQSGVNRRNPEKRRKIAWTCEWNWQGRTVTRGWGLREETEGSRGGVLGEQEGWVTPQPRTSRRGLRPATHLVCVRPAPRPPTVVKHTDPKSPTAGGRDALRQVGEGKLKSGEAQRFARWAVCGRETSPHFLGVVAAAEERLLEISLCWRIFWVFTLHPRTESLLTAERPQCLRQVRPGSGTESGVKKIFCIFSDYKNSISVEKKWKFHTSTREKEKHKLYTTSTHNYYNYFGVYSSSPYIYDYICIYIYDYAKDNYILYNI